MEMMNDDMLISELRRRFEESRIAIGNLRTMTQNLETVNEKLRQSESLKSDFLSNIRNEIINPLASILGLARRIADKQPDGRTAQEMAAAIFHEAFDLDFQLRNIFTAAELEAGDAGLSVANVDVAALVHGLISAFAHKAAEKRLAVEFLCRGCAENVLLFKTDPDKLQKVLANLLANAIEFNLEGKKVTITAWREADRLFVSIRDEGIGIPEKDRKKVFDRFVQLETGSRKRHRGHGLGLSITRALVELLGGSVTLAGEEGKGCVFTVTAAEQGSGRDVDVLSGEGNEFIFGEGKTF